MADGDWHYAVGNEQLGPIDLGSLQDLIRNGTLKRDDRVWRPGMNQWLRAGDLAILAAVFEGDRPPPMPLPQPMPGQWPGQTMGGNLNYPMPWQPRTGPVTYAGFWLRFAAYLIDQIILSFVGFALGFVIGFVGVIALGTNRGVGMVFVNLAAQLAALIISWLYYALLESSSQQATLGKLALGIQVIDLQGQRISFGNATGRYFAKALSFLTLCVGFMMAGWTERKQALHDFLANTLVVCKS